MIYHQQQPQALPRSASLLYRRIPGSIHHDHLLNAGKVGFTRTSNDTFSARRSGILRESETLRLARF